MNFGISWMVTVLVEGHKFISFLTIKSHLL